MCGICGYAGDNQPELLKKMAATMLYRGPDDSGTWHDANAGVGLAHRRLSILDLSPGGHQPMANADGSVIISYNGETYNFQDFRSDLESKGYVFRSKSDTEVLLYLYEEYGDKFISMLNGMFAIAIWDGRRQELLLARDHAGVKPLYYWRDGDRLFFASEIKALLKVPGIPRSMNHNVLNTYLTLLWVPGRETMFEGIEKLEPGHLIRWKDGQIESKQWFDLSYEPDESVQEQEWVERVYHTFRAATRRQMVSDVPLGAFLSGGLDSSSIVACMRDSYPEREINCYTMAYDPKDLLREGIEDDYPHAKNVAEHLGINMKSQVLTPDAIRLMPKMVYHMDEPDSDPTAILTYIVSKMAREDGTTVLLSGAGGDEVFFGYRSHQAYRQFERFDMLPQGITNMALSAAESVTSRTRGAQSAWARRFRKFRKALKTDDLQRHMALQDWSSPETRMGLWSEQLREHITQQPDTPACMTDYFEGFRGAGKLNRHSHVLIQTFLAAHNFLYTDKCAMATTIETRVPFMDTELMRLCASIPERYKLRGNTTKYILKKAMERHLPQSVIYRGKTGFTPPLREWIVNGLEPLIEECLSEANVKKRGLFNPQAVNRVLDENRRNIRDHGYLIYALLTLEVWMRTFIDKPGEELVW